MTPVPDSFFHKVYDGQPPWETGRPQPAVIELADAGAFVAPVLDVGCGTGENAILLAERGLKVVGTDLVPKAIESARWKAAARGLVVDFRVLDARRLGELGGTFATALDSGLFHVFSDDDRAAYVEALRGVLQPDGRFYLIVFSEREPGPDGPRRVTAAEIRSAFAAGWAVEEVRPTRYEVLSRPPGPTFSEGGAHAWLAVIRRTD